MKRYVWIGMALGCALFLAACSAPGDSSPGVSSESSDVSPAGYEASVSPAESSLSTSEAGDAYHKITAEDAKKMIDEGNVTVVDVRTAGEYEDAHIPGAILVPNETIGDEQPELLPDKDAVLLVHCRTGIRSRQASEKLVELGYTQIYDFGGIVDWPYETESGAAQ